MHMSRDVALPSVNDANTLSVEISKMTPRKSALQSPDLGVTSPWNNGQLFSSASVEWSTPEDFFAKVEAEFGTFELDAAATARNAVCASFLGPELDALSCPDWSLPEMEKRLVWMNPPWGRGIGGWVAKASQQSQEHHLTVVCLLPASTDTSWWHDVVMAHADEVRLIRGRLHFVRDDGHTGPCTKGCALVVFRGESATSPRFSSMTRSHASI